MPLLHCLITIALLTDQGPPRTPAITPETIRTSDVPASPVAVVTYMVRGHAEQASDLLFVVWRGQADWYRGRPHSSSGGGSGTSFTSTASYGAVRLTVEGDLGKRTVRVQGIRVELGDSNVILVDDIDRPQTTRVVKALRVEPSGQLGRGPSEPLRLLGSSPEIVDFTGCAAAGSGRPFCWMIVGKDGKQE